MNFSWKIFLFMAVKQDNQQKTLPEAHEKAAKWSSSAYNISRVSSSGSS